MGHLDEAATRAQRIDAQLRERAWDEPGVDFEVEYEVGSAGDPDHGFTDYLLPDEDGSPLAVVEAKRSSRDALVGKEQARLYVEGIYNRTGIGPSVFLANGDEIWFWDLVSNPRRVMGFFTRRDLQRRRFQLAEKKNLADVGIDGAIVQRPYQHEAIRRLQKAFKDEERRGLWVMATGTGKTRAAVALVDTLLKGRWAQRALFLVDRDALGTQAIDAFKEHLPSEPTARIRSSAYDTSKRLYVATLQTMQDFYWKLSPGEFDFVISDECHRSIYNKWEAVLSYFDARLLGLTATPADFIDRNTFSFFDCPSGQPTYAYEYEQAVLEKYLTPFEVYHARTGFQIEGVQGTDLPPDQQALLIDQGIDPEDIDFAGTQLERQWTNKETTRLVVNEFFEMAIKEPEGNMPGKSIIFAWSHAHAVRLWDMFNAEFPQFPGLAEIIDSQMEQPDEILRRFKTESLPRIAISVDMLDTGVDVPTVVNLGFMKPVFSRIKFWQMIGRGTRLVDEESAKPWLPAGKKDVFRILDFGNNFERFQLNPEGVEPTAAIPVAVRVFRLFTKLAKVANQQGRTEVEEAAVARLRSLVEQLHPESAGVRENRRLVETLKKDSFWAALSEAKFQVLIWEAAALMRYIQMNLAELTFEAKCAEFAIADLSGDQTKRVRAAEKIREDVMRLPVQHPDISPVSAIVQAVHDPGWVGSVQFDDVEKLRTELAKLMHLREREDRFLVTLDLQDAFKEQRWIAVGPEAREFEVDEYRVQVESRVRELAESHPSMMKIAAGFELTDEDLIAIEEVLNAPDLYMTESTLQQTYQAPQQSLFSLLRHVLGIESIPDRTVAIRDAFEAFIGERGYLDADKILFARLVAQRLIQVGKVELADLFEPPFSQLGTAPDQLLPPDDLDALLGLSALYEVSHAGR